MIDIAVTLLPHPLSPTSPTTSPAATSKPTSSTTDTGPASVLKADRQIFDAEQSHRRASEARIWTGGDRAPPAASFEHDPWEVERNDPVRLIDNLADAQIGTHAAQHVGLDRRHAVLAVSRSIMPETAA